jgi:Anti-sigma factor NepR
MSGADKEPTGGISPPAKDWTPLLDEEDNGPEVSPLVVDAVGRALQTHFQAIAEMPLPDRFLVLLAELEARERST